MRAFRSLRSIVVLLLVALAACSTGGHDRSFWATAKCSQLNGIRFKVTFFKDNQKAYDDVLFFRNDTLISEKWYAAGFHTAEIACRDGTPGEIKLKATMLNAMNDWRQYVITFANGEPDGTLMEGTGDGSSFTYTFAGREE
jgi:hypothetical protein